MPTALGAGQTLDEGDEPGSDVRVTLAAIRLALPVVVEQPSLKSFLMESPTRPIRSPFQNATVVFAGARRSRYKPAQGDVTRCPPSAERGAAGW